MKIDVLSKAKKEFIDDFSDLGIKKIPHILLRRLRDLARWRDD